MIRLSRTFTRLLLTWLLVVSPFGVQSRCLAEGAESQMINVETAFGCDLFHFHLVESKSSRCQNSDRSCFEIAESWWRFRSYRTFRVAHEMADRGTAMMDSCRKWQQSQQNRIRESVNFAALKCSGDLAQLAATWLDQWLTSGGPDDTSMVARTPIDRTKSDDQEIDQQSAYWTYYQDCERWGVELAQLPQHDQLDVGGNRIGVPGCTNEDADRSATDRKAGADSVAPALKRMSQWLGHAFKEIEFAVVESQVWYQADVVGQAD